MKINIENKCFSIDNREILNKVNLTINKGDLLIIMGHSGSGKSTLINLLLGVIKSKEWNLPKKELNKVSVLFQNPEHQLFSLTVKNEIRNHNSEASIILDDLGIHEDIYELSPFSLSEGMKKKIVIANIILQNKEILFFDELTSNVDENSKLKLVEIVKKLSKEGKTIVIISHDIELVKSLNGRLIVLNKGKKVFDGSTKRGIKDIELYTKIGYSNDE